MRVGAYGNANSRIKGKWKRGCWQNPNIWQTWIGLGNVEKSDFDGSVLMEELYEGGILVGNSGNVIINIG